MGTDPGSGRLDIPLANDFPFNKKKKKKQNQAPEISGKASET